MNMGYITNVRKKKRQGSMNKYPDMVSLLTSALLNEVLLPIRSLLVKKKLPFCAAALLDYVILFTLLLRLLFRRRS